MKYLRKQSGYTLIEVVVATAIFLPLVGVAIWVGQYIPLNYDNKIAWNILAEL